MTMYLVSYDLIGPNRDYTKVIEHLKTYEFRATPLESVWILNSEKTAKQIREDLQKHTDENDKIFVVALQPRIWSTANISKPTLDWMHKHL